MKYNTRFNPTVSGELHIGHVYTALVNASEAHRSKGKFILRIDDTQEYWNDKLGKLEVDRLSDLYWEQLSLFMPIDYVDRQSRMPKIIHLVDTSVLSNWIMKPMYMHDQVPEWIPDIDMVMYPYAPWYTLEKVAWDFYEGINWLIRGEDLVSEFSLYNYFVEAIGLPRMRHTYIPRLRGKYQEELSKTFGSFRLSEQIDIFGVDGIYQKLSEVCLINPDNGFYIENLKCRPTITGFKE